MQHRRQGLGHAVAAGDQVVDVPLHEDRAAVAGPGGAHGSRLPRNVRQGRVEPPRLFLDEGAGAGGADGVHDRGSHHAVLEGRELGVLAADLDDRIDLRVQVEGSPGMGGDLIDHQIRTDDGGDELAAGPCGTHAGKSKFDCQAVSPALDGLENGLCGDERPAGGARVEAGHHLAGLVQKHRLGAGGADVEAQEQPGFSPAGDRAIDVHLDWHGLPDHAGFEQEALDPPEIGIIRKVAIDRTMGVRAPAVLLQEEFLGRAGVRVVPAGRGHIFSIQDLGVQEQRGAIGTVLVRPGIHHQIAADQGREVPHHGDVLGHAAGEHDGRAHRTPEKSASTTVVANPRQSPSQMDSLE